LNISDDTSSVAKSAQDLKNAVGIINKPPPPAVKTKPTNLSRSSSSSNDAFQSSLSRGKPLPPASVAAPPPPKVSVPVPAPPSISMPASKPTIATPATPSVSSNDEKVSVPNPLYASIRCGGCQKAISGVVINAMGKRWHANCFNCKQCGENLEHMAFFEKDGFPYCGLDYHEQFSLRCDYCNTPIEEASEYDMEESRTRMIVLTVCL
jgi:paxillin